MFKNMLLLSCVTYLSANTIRGNVSSSASVSASTLTFFQSRTLTTPLKHLPSLRILLRSRYLQIDVINGYVRWFLEHSSTPLVITSYDDTLPSHKPDPLRLFLSGRDSFVIATDGQQLRNAAQRFVQRAGTFFFILCNETSAEDIAEMRHVLHSLWFKYNVFKNYLLTDIGIFIYDPFHYDTTRQEYGQIVIYDGREPLERLLFHDMRGYPLRIQIFKAVYSHPHFAREERRIQDVGGVDGRVAELLQQRMNFTMHLQEPDPNYFGERSPNGSYNGAIRSIIENKLDLCLTGFFIKDYMVSDYMDFTAAVYDDQLCIFVPKAKRVPQSILPIFAVRYDLWLGFILTAFACAFIWWIIRRLNLYLGIGTCEDTPLDKSQHMQLIRIYIDTWVLWVRVNLVRYPPFNSERIYVASLCLVSVIFGAIFESSLATVYIQPLHYKDISNLQELDKSKLKVVYKYSAMADDLFFSETSPLFANLNKKLKHVSNLNADVKTDVAYNGGKAGVTRLTSLLLESLHLIRSKRLWIVPECPKYYTISYVMPRDAPWEDAVNNMLLNFVGAGLIKKWINDMQTAVEIKVMKSGLGLDSSETFKVLTVADLQLAFYVLLIGNTLAALSVLIERHLKLRKSLRNPLEKHCGMDVLCSSGVMHT